jgi:hypothetical protein
MWVERVELTGYGGIKGENIIFAQDKLNLVVEPNEYGKSTMATAIWSILFNFPEDEKPVYLSHEENNKPLKMTEKEARRPKNQDKDSVYSARMDVTTSGRRLTILRDFNANTFHVFDRDKKNQEVTQEFKGPGGEDEVGQKVTGMTRELFKSTCFVGQRELDEHAFGGASDLATLVQSIADSASPSGTSAQAVRVLNETLDRIPMADRRQKADHVIRDLEMARTDLLNKIRAFERDRQDVAASFDRLMIINRVLSGDTSRVKATEFQNLQYQLNDVVSRLDKLKGANQRRAAIERRLGELFAVSEIPAEMRRPIEELWTRRNIKAQELERLESELSPQQLNYEETKTVIMNRYLGLDKFTPEEIQQIAQLAGSMATAEEEFGNMQERLERERVKVTGGSSGAQDLDQLRRSMQSLEAEGIESARSYNSLILAFQDQIIDAERSLHQTRAKQKEIEGKRIEEAQKRKSLGMLLIFLAVVMVVLGIVTMILVKGVAFIGPVLIVLGLGLAGGASFVLRPVLKPHLIFFNEFEAVRGDIARITSELEEKHNKVGSLENKLDTLARKVGLSARNELMTKLEEYGSQATKLKELEIIEQLLEQKRQSLNRYKMDLERHLKKAAKPEIEPTAMAAKQLSDALASFMEDSRALEQNYQDASSSSRKLSTLKEELDDVDQALINLLSRSGIRVDVPIQVGDSAAMTQAMQAIGERIEAFSEVSKLHDELADLDREQGDANEAAAQIKQLEEYKSRVVQQMDLLKFQNPGIETLPQLLPEEMSGSEAPQNLQEQESLREEREDLLVRIRTLSNNCDEQYLNCLEELDLTEFRLQCAKRAKVALEIARDTLKRLAGENYVDWATNLNNIAKEMLSKLGLDYEEVKFDEELRLVARRKNEKEELSSAQIMSQLSIGAKEQIHWLARMVVARYLSKHNTLPIIMDEPFSESDDERFAKLMRFLINSIAKEHQIVLFSCHQQRHSWLRSQLEDSEKGRLLFCRRQKN